MPYYGRRVTSRDYEWGYIGSDDQRATVFNAMPENGWGTHLGAWLGTDPSYGNWSGVLEALTTNASKQPQTYLGYTSPFTVSVDLGDETGQPGASYESAISTVNSSLSPGTNAIKLEAGKRYSVKLLNDDASDLGRFSMIAASRIPYADNKYFYDKYSDSYPGNPYSWDDANYNGWISLWIKYVKNTKPVAATVGPSGIITTATPNFEGSFTDAESSYGDKLKNFRITVRDADTLETKWSSGTLSATSGEQAAAQFTRAYGGSTLTQGEEYEWQCEVSDQFGEWSALTAWESFTVSSGGTVAASSPTGKQTTKQPGPFVALWDDSGSLNADRARVKIYRGGDLILDSGDLTISVADGNNISISWATAFSTDELSWGVDDYSWTIEARNTATLWSDPDGLDFSTNAAPSIPSGLSPSGGKASSSYPLLECVVSDADDDFGDLTVTARIKDSGGSLLYLREMSYNATTGKFERQMTAIELASYATYRWDVYSYDGDLYSGEATSSANATKSAEESFVYAQGPDISVSAPTVDQVLTTSSVYVAWSLSSGGPQSSYWVRLYRDSDDELVYDSGQVVSSTMNHTIPSGYVIDNEAYYVVVTVESTAPLTGESAQRDFSINYTEPSAPLNFLAEEQYQQFDASPSSMYLSWTATALTNFREYIVGRRHSGEDESAEVILARLASQSIDEWTDYHAPANADLVYSLRVSEYQGVDIVTSDRTESEATLRLENVVIVGIDDPVSTRVALPIDLERYSDLIDDLFFEEMWGEEAPLAQYGGMEFDRAGGRFALLTDSQATADQYMEALREIRRARKHVSYRDSRKRRIFGVISRLRESDIQNGGYNVEVEINEVAYEEGVE